MSELKIYKMPSEPEGVDDAFSRLPHNDLLFKPPFTLLVLGTIGAGKTSFIYSLLAKYYRGYFDQLLIFTGTKDSNQVWQDELVPAKGGSVQIYNRFVNAEFADWADALETHQMERRDNKEPPLRIMVMFDDMMGQQISVSAGARTSLDNFMLHCRHYNASVILATQYLKLVSRASREQGMFCVAFRMNAEQLEDFIDAFRRHADKHALRALYHAVRDEVGNPFQFLLVDGKTGERSKVFRKGFSTYMDLPNAV